MASLGHIAIGMAAGRAFVAPGESSRRAQVAFSLLSMWPDADVIGFRFGVAYGDPWGHRGATHSICLALLAGLLCHLATRHLRHPPGRVFVFATLVGISHPLLDTMTYGGGLGCALGWPLSNARYWAPWRFLPVAPIGLHMLTPRGLRVALIELAVFAPLWIYALWPRRAAAR